MNNWTIPRRITLGYLLLVLLSIILGLTALWRIRDINSQVTMLARNTVPSVVLLGNVNASTIRLRRMASRVLLSEGSNRSAAEQAFQETKAEGDRSVAEYKETCIADQADADLLEAVRQVRLVLMAACDKVVAAAAREGGKEEAQGILLNEVDPALAKCEDAMGRHIDYNVTLGEAAAKRAMEIVQVSYLGVGGTLALAAILGSIVGWLTVRAAKRSLGGISDSLESGASHTSTASSQLSSSSQSLAEGCAEQGSSVAETSAALEQMSVMIRSTSDNAERAKGFANQARHAAQQGADTMVEMNTAMSAIEASSAEVAKIVKNIDEIAFQTNILALNAAVEAARAGEAGAGFAVVADEVRSLAQRSAAAAKETAEKIEAAIANSRRGSVSCGKVGESLREIVEKVGAADGLVAEISTAAKEQAQGIQQVGQAMTQMDKITQANASSAAETASAAEELNSQAKTLQDLVDHLRALVGAVGSPAASRGNDVPRLAAPRSPARTRITAGGRPLVPTRESRRSLGHIPMPEQGPYDDQEDRNFKDF